MKRVEALALLCVAGMLTLAGCSTSSPTTSPATSGAGAPSSADTPSVTPVVEGSATASSTPATIPSPAATSSTTVTSSSTTAGTAGPTSSASPTPKPAATAPTPKGATSQGLPESFAGWMRVDVDDSLGYPSAGYSSDAGTLRLQLRPATSPEALVTTVTTGRYVPIGATPCASSARMNACAMTKGNRVVLISSATLETEELADLLPQASKAIG